MIDGTGYLTAKKYAEIKGLSLLWISKLKNDIPFVKFEDKEIIERSINVERKIYVLTTKGN